MQQIPLKSCGRCRVRQPKTNFSKHKRRRDGLQTECKGCRKAYTVTRERTNSRRNELRPPNENLLKRCTSCRKLKRLVEFPVVLRNRSGRGTTCNHCSRRHEPYKSDAKADYRAVVWDLLLMEGEFYEKRGGRVMFMPASKGPEVDLLRALGVEDGNMVMVDEKPAVVASAKASNKAKGAQGVGRRMSKAGPYVLKKGKVSIANFDMCGPSSMRTLREVQTFLKSGAMAERCRVSVTYLRGREDGVAGEVFKMMGLGRDERITRMAESAGFKVLWSRSGSYQNGKSPMGWTCMELVSVD